MCKCLKFGYSKLADAKAKTEYSSLFASATAKSSLLCTNGPYYKYYYKPGYLYWPPIRYRSCDGLKCSPGKCVATSTRVVYRWAIVFKCNYHYCHFVGIRFLRFIEHLRCQCRECTSNADCQYPKVCNRSTYKCVCPATGNCNYGYVWDRVQCKCVKCVAHSCPRGYYFDYGVCDCARIDRPTIPHIP